MRRLVHVPADESPAKDLHDGWPEHRVELHVVHHRKSILGWVERGGGGLNMLLYAYMHSDVKYC